MSDRVGTAYLSLGCSDGLVDESQSLPLPTSLTCLVRTDLQLAHSQDRGLSFFIVVLPYSSWMLVGGWMGGDRGLGDDGLRGPVTR